MQHRVRDQLVRQRTQLINALRSHMAELGIIAAQGRDGLKEVLAIVADASDNRLPMDARASLMVLAAQLQACQTLIGTLEKRIIVQHKSNDRSRRLQTIPGIGVIGATAIDATVADPKAFRSGRDFAAWIGLVPRQDSTGGKQKLGHISKQGDQYLRRIPRRGCSRRPAARPTASREVSLAHRLAGSAAIQGRGGSARQQDGAHRLGAAGQGRNLSSAGACGSRLMGFSMGRMR